MILTFGELQSPVEIDFNLDGRYSRVGETLIEY